MLEMVMQIPAKLKIEREKANCVHNTWLHRRLYRRLLQRLQVLNNEGMPNLTQGMKAQKAQMTVTTSAAA